MDRQEGISLAFAPRRTNVAPSPREERQFNSSEASPDRHVPVGAGAGAVAGGVAAGKHGGFRRRAASRLRLSAPSFNGTPPRLSPCIWVRLHPGGPCFRSLSDGCVIAVCLRPGELGTTALRCFRVRSGDEIDKCAALPLSDKLLAMCGGLWRAAALSRSRISHGADELSTEAVGWIEHSEPHHLAAGSSVGLAAARPPYSSPHRQRHAKRVCSPGWLSH